MGPRKALVREVNPHLICVLCHGYFIEATTITECLHSFCRSCLIKYLETSKFCPICDVQLHKNNPLLSVRCDQTLQQLVYKLVPGLYANEMARRRKYYSELGGPSSDPECSEYPVGDAYFAPDDSVSLSLEFSTLSSCFKDDDACASESDDSLSIDKQNVLHRRYLQCPAAVTMSHLQKFLRMKYGFSHDVKVDIIYEGEVLSDHFSLMDVAYTFNWKRTAPMRFKFRLFQKAGANAKGSTIERINRPLETKDKDDMVPKPIAEAKVFAFASVHRPAPSISNKSTQSHSAPPKTVREPHVVMQCLDSKEVMPLGPRDKNPYRENKSISSINAKENGLFKEMKNLKESKKADVKHVEALKLKNAAGEKIATKVNNPSFLKRTHSSSGESEEEPPVEMKKLKIVLEPIALGPKQETMKIALNRQELSKIDTLKQEPTKAIQPQNQSQSLPKRECSPAKNNSTHLPKDQLKEKPKETAAKQKPEPAGQPMEEAEDDDEEPNYMDDIIQEEDYDEEDDEERLRKTPSESDMVIEEKDDDAMDVQIDSHPPDDPQPDFKSARYSKSEEKRKEKKKNKKAKHHHHRHHDRKRESPPIATILHSPDSDLKLKFKLTNTNSKPKYTILDNSESRKEYYALPKVQDKSVEKDPVKDQKIKPREDEKVDIGKKSPPPVLNNNYNLNNNNNIHQIRNNQLEPIKSMALETGSKEKPVQLKISKAKVFQPPLAPKAPSPSVAAPKVPSPKVPSPKIQSPMAQAPPLTKLTNQSQSSVNTKVMNLLQKSTPSPKQQVPLAKQNGTSMIKQEPIKMPPSSITVSKITAAEKAQMEQQKILMQRNNSMGLDSKRPSLEIMLVNAPKKSNESNVESKPSEVKKVIRPTPPSIPLSRLKNFGPKGSPPPLVLASSKGGSPGEDNGALDLSGKSSRKSPEIESMRNLVMLSNTAAQERILMTSLEPLKIPIPPAMSMKTGFQQNQQQRAIKPGPNQNVRQIPNPSALMFRQHINNQRSVPPSLPINSLRKMESMAKNINIEKVAAGLTVKAAVQAGYQAK